MIITVTSLKFKKNKYEVTFSNDEKVVCNEDMIVKFRLVKGKELSLDTYKNIRISASYFDFYDKALSYIAKGPKSKNKIYLYLMNKECAKEHANLIIEELSNKKLIDDFKYFEMLASHYLRKNYGQIYIRQKGIEEKIDKNIIEEVLNDIDYDIYLENARTLALKKYNTIKAKDSYERKIKLKNYLLSRGYTYEIINEVTGGLNDE